MRFSLFPRSRPAHPELATDSDPNLFRWTVAVYLCLGLTLLFDIGLSVWGVLHDLDQVRKTLITAELHRVRSHVLRTVSHLQDMLRNNGEKPGIDSLKEHNFLRRRWQESVLKLKDDADLYGALVDPAGKIVMHSDPRQEQQSLGPVWYDQVVSEEGDDVVLTQSAALTGGKKVMDVRVPIYRDNAEVGTYHIGLSCSWLEKELATKREPTLRMWAWIQVGSALVVVVAGVSLLQISRRMAMLREGVKLARARRFAEVGQLMAGIVHEIRNPLNAMRLNLHVLGRHQARKEAANDAVADEGSATDLAQIIQETHQEIERVEGLMRVLLGYTRPDRPHLENLDVRQEIQSTLSFLSPVLEQAEIGVRARFPEVAVLIQIDRDRLRQIVINLINNAKEATGPGGQIQVAVTRIDGNVEIIVADDGPGVPAADRERIFEPFFSTKEDGTGLGLALVRRYIEEVGGTITFDDNEPRGARFRLRFHEVARTYPTSDPYQSTL